MFSRRKVEQDPDFEESRPKKAKLTPEEKREKISDLSKEIEHTQNPI